MATNRSSEASTAIRVLNSTVTAVGLAMPSSSTSSREGHTDAGTKDASATEMTTVPRSAL